MKTLVRLPVLGGQVTRSLILWYLFTPLVHLQMTEVPFLLQATFLIPLNLSTEVVREARMEIGAFFPVLEIPTTSTW